MTITKEGALASFYTINKAPIKHLKVYFSPKQTGSGDPSPENVREISGWDKVYTYQYGKNLCQQLPPNIVTGHIRDDNGIEKVSFNYFYISTLYPVLNINEFGIRGIQSEAWRPYFLDNAKNFISRGYIYSSPQKNSMPVKIYPPDNCAYIQLQILNNSDISDLQIYNQIKNWSITTSFPTTIYGGYVDLITGEVWKTHHMIELDNINYYFETVGTSYHHIRPLNYPAPIMNNNDVIQGTGNLQSFGKYFFYANHNSKSIFVDNVKLNNGGFNSLEELSTFLTMSPQKMTYEMATPQLLTILSPIELQTFIGQNNIWSNADRVEVEYDLAESNDELYRRRNIILNGYPHIETASGNIANFQTDMIAPIKNAKFYFNPIQEGSGDPSPENVREINGWTDFNIYTGKNINYTTANTDNEDNSKVKVDILSPNSLHIYTTDSTYYPATRQKMNNLPFVIGKAYIIKGHILINNIIQSGSGSGQILFGFRDSSNTYIKPSVKLYDPDIGILEQDFIYTFTVTSNFSYLSLCFITLGGQYDIILSNLQAIEIDNSYPISWTSNGTIYGGYVDLIMGDLYQTYGYYNLGDNNLFHWGYGGGNGTIWYGNIAYNNIFKPVTNNNVTANMYCTQYKVLPYSTFSHSNDKDMSIGWDTVGAPRIRNNAYNSSTATEFKASLDGIYVAVELKNPIYITTLTPQQLLTLRGTNNIWSTANGQTEITYWTH